MTPNDLNFSEPAKRDQAVSNFISLLKHPGWQLLELIVGENIKVLTQQILKKPEGATEIEMDRLRDKLAVHEDIINTPLNIIKKLTPSEGGEVDDGDPYPRVG